MKTIILFSLALVLATNSAPAPDSVPDPDPDPVLDAQQKPLRSGVKYYIKPADGDGYIGGLILAHIGNKSCPVVVAQSRGIEKGLSLTFTPVNPKKDVIRLSTDVNIKFSGSNKCHESNVWKLKYNKLMKEYVVMVGGVEGNPGPETLNNWFKIEKSTYGGYKFVFCPSVCSYCKVMCEEVNTLLTDDSNGQPLVLSNDTYFPFSVIFYR